MAENHSIVKETNIIDVTSKPITREEFLSYQIIQQEKNEKQLNELSQAFEGVINGLKDSIGEMAVSISKVIKDSCTDTCKKYDGMVDKLESIRKSMYVINRENKTDAKVEAKSETKVEAKSKVNFLLQNSWSDAKQSEWVESICHRIKTVATILNEDRNNIVKRIYNQMTNNGIAVDKLFEEYKGIDPANKDRRRIWMCSADLIRPSFESILDAIEQETMCKQMELKYKQSESKRSQMESRIKQILSGMEDFNNADHNQKIIPRKSVELMACPPEIKQGLEKYSARNGVAYKTAKSQVYKMLDGKFGKDTRLAGMAEISRATKIRNVCPAYFIRHNKEWYKEFCRITEGE